MGGDDGPPALTLQHELSHAWDHLHDSAIDIGGRTYTETRHFPDGHTEDRVAPRPELNSVGFAGDGRVTFPIGRPTSRRQWPARSGSPSIRALRPLTSSALQPLRSSP
jgi:hypothetical protein